MADQGLLVGQAEPARGSSAGNDQRAGLDRGLLPTMSCDRALAEVGLDDVAGAILGAEARGLLAHVVDQFRALNAFGKAGKVFDQRGDRELSAGLMAFDDQRLEVGAGE